MKLYTLGFGLSAILFAAVPAAAGQPVQISASYSVQTYISSSDDVEITTQETQVKKALYARAARECQDIIATIALACRITSMNVSTQVSRNYGQPPQIYATANTTMEVTLK